MLTDYADTFLTEEDAEGVLGVPVLGFIPSVEEETHRLIRDVSTFSPVMESFRWLRTNLRYVAELQEKSSHCLLITSAVPAEGKSTTAANLAIALARDGKRVVLVDADLRRPRQHTLFDLEPSPGLVEVLVGSHTTAEVLRPTGMPNLSVIPEGSISLNPTELLGSDAMTRFLAELRTQFDFVLVDSSPALAVADAMILATLADAVLFVVGHGDTKKIHAAQAIKYLARTRARVVGAVFNRIRTGPMGGLQFYFGKYYVPSVTPLADILPERTVEARLMHQERPN